MKNLTQKLKSKRGETLVEILVSIFILGLSIGFMALMIQTSYVMNQQARAEDGKYYDELSEAEKMDSPARDISGAEISKKVTITKPDGTTAAEIDVKMYGSVEGKALRSYSVD